MDYLEKARRVIQLEMEELQRLHAGVGESFVQSIDILKAAIEAGNKVVVAGIGKSYNIGHKIAATFNSTGTSSVVLNTQNALHGDLGLVREGDVIFALSYSGETTELLALLPHLKRSGVKIIAMTGDLDSTLAKNADAVLDVRVEREACPLGLAPTSSSTMMLVLGDALAMVMLEARGFSEKDFARLHPGGALGRVLLTRVSDIMRKDAQLAKVTATDTIRHTLDKMTAAHIGAALVIAPDGSLDGIFTHGDFVRAIHKDNAALDKPVGTYMTKNPVSIEADRLAAETLQVLGKNKVDDIVVIDANGHPVGLVDTQDLSRLKIL
jgi:arabinose-5-phosphate isomerase